MFDIQDNEISKRYVEEYNAISGLEELAAHCKKWHDVLGFDAPPCWRGTCGIHGTQTTD